MPIDANAARSAEPQVRTIAWTRRDVLLYHLSLGAGRHAEVDPELRWTYERDLQVLPTFAMVAGGGPSVGDLPPADMRLPGIDIDLRRILHGGQKLTVHRPIPPAGSATVSTRVADVWDKQKAAVIVLQGDATAPDGEPLWTTTMQIWARGEGGFGGEPGPVPISGVPDRAPDHRLVTTTDPGQALLYRLNGDLNPLHVDPEFAAAAGFDRPILHGLASYGIVAKALVDEVLDGDASRLTALDVRFAGTVVPGQTIATAVWRSGDELTLVSTRADETGTPVLTHATATVRV
ncbi:MaoC/PaaZ C-terminal domain-containing protein [Aeromicrobium fastidiosum]|uniref:3-alpha,7-alpha, 12-alpha-trihydroxy-5-beta-cholest-24-enoyl-CoA hydratase n=1 Tax=Aeromicrobium fastidiosum TaxID=52699 RepID=A0A641AQC5_9ACTN|nr:MaoC/PaaZ C-terminal domain-containing protein [Aeromicrobium fastidiosum]KAA1379882.1 3-alpha,7-alpha,12-alpha-trihydroxy-5-beta-cholest-24-enoyl-CoA hydratase [Aeromicrobium fastidiosum]MBP2389386.1 acyl dehydratase [Aeromicrobium fastidiosum]